MKRFIALTLWALVLTMLSTVAWAASGIVFRSGSPWAALADWQSEWERSQVLAQDTRCEGYTRRIVAKSMVANEIIAGRLTLLEAAASFRVLDHQPPERRWDIFRAYYEGHNDEERHCREVIDTVAFALDLDRDPSRSGLVERLKAELDEILRRQGTVTLPPACG